VDTPANDNTLYVPFQTISWLNQMTSPSPTHSNDQGMFDETWTDVVMLQLGDRHASKGIKAQLLQE